MHRRLAQLIAPIGDLMTFEIKKIGNSVGLILAEGIACRGSMLKRRRQASYRRATERGLQAFAIRPEASRRRWKSPGGLAAATRTRSRRLQNERADLARRARSLFDLHAEQLALFGGRGRHCAIEGMLESALDRPINKCRYGETDLAATCRGLCVRHCAKPSLCRRQQTHRLRAMMVFLGLNDIDFFVPDPRSATAIILSLAAGEVSEESLTRWIRDNWPSEARSSSRRSWCTNGPRRCSPGWFAVIPRDRSNI